MITDTSQKRVLLYHKYLEYPNDEMNANFLDSPAILCLCGNDSTGCPRKNETHFQFLITLKLFNLLHIFCFIFYH